MLRRVIYTLLLITWMIIIFLFSNQGSLNSIRLSDKLTQKTINTVNKVTGKEVKDESKTVINNRFIIRKAAHFTLYFILGVLVYQTLSSYGVKKYILVYSVLFCLVYASSDEIHQLFNDRTFRKLDIFIDTLGGLTGSTLIHFFTKRLTNH